MTTDAIATAILASNQLRARIPKSLEGVDRALWCETVAKLATLPCDADALAKWDARMKEVYEVEPR